jgi:protein O-GlcNAc transferase
MTDTQKSFNAAIAALNAQNVVAAEALFREVLRADRKHIAALNLLTVVLMSRGRFAEAEEFIERATRLNRTSDISFYNYGLISKHLNKPQQALDNFNKAIALNPTVAETWNNRGTIFNDLQKYDLALLDFDRAISLNDRYAEAYANKAKSLTFLERSEEALATYDKALSHKPDLAEAWLGRGNVFRDLRRQDEAFAAYDKALALRPDLAEAWLGRGNLLSHFKRHEEAFAAYEKALALKPDLAEAWLGRGNELRDLKRHDEAFAAYVRALSLKPDLMGAWLGRGNVLRDLRRHDEAFAAYDKALSHKPDLAEAWLGRGNVLSDLKRHDEAFAAYDKALSLMPDLAGAWLGRGNTLRDLMRHDEAFAAYDRALSLEPDLAEAWLGRGNVFGDLKRQDQALAAYDKALSLEPDLAEAQLGRGHVFSDLKRHDEAFAAYDMALSLKPDLAGAWLGRGNLSSGLKRHDEALAAYHKALSHKPDLADAWHGLGQVFGELNRHDEALAAYDKALSHEPDLAEAWLGRGNVFSGLKRHDEALAAYDKALSQKPDLAEAWLGRGNMLADLKHQDEALAAFDKALSHKPDLAEAQLGRGHVFTDLRRHDEAFTAYDNALSHNPDLVGAEGYRLSSKLQVCNWENFRSDCDHLIESVRNNKEGADPFVFLAIHSTAEDQNNCARLWVNKLRGPAQQLPRREDFHKHDKIRVGYVSADFHEHATAHLMAGVFEEHDRSRFDITAISIGPDDNSAMRRRLEGSFETFVDAQTLGDAEVTRQIRATEIDILIDLKGFTRGARPNIFARRAAPIQVNYLGYPGTMGASYIDYIVADSFVIPTSHRSSYAEKIVYLPNSYQANDTGRNISEKMFTKAECGLPDAGFVFCCFNNNYKFTPGMFDLWMRILKSVDGSVLWLLEDNAAAAANMRKEAEVRGIDPARLVFAARMPPSDHLARHRLADLALDTLPCNAHTTASDCLWAGLPLLTQMGETFAGRVAASLLNAINLPELITETPQEYERLAIDLAMDPEKLRTIKSKLSENRLTAPLFDTRLFTGHIEAAYVAMYERHQAGLAPDHIVVPH